MKPVIAWIKANLWIPVFALIGVVVLAGGWVGSSAWNNNIHTSRQSKAEDALRRLKQVNVPYTELAMEPGETPYSRTEPPNERVTEWFRARRAAQMEQAARVVELAQITNGAGRGVLVEGLFPQPAPGELQAKTIEMARKMVQNERSSSAFEAILREHGAISPPNSEQIAAVLRDAQQREKDRLRAGGRTGEDIAKEAEEVIERKLIEQRIGEYRRRADQGSFYATPAIFPAEVSGSKLGPVLPKEVPATPPTLERCFEWQFDYWVVSDILRAVSAANTDVAGGRTLVPDSVVKRIERIAIEGFLPTHPPDQIISPLGDPKSGVLAPNFMYSATGRGALNHLYDIRRAEVRMVVAIDRLPALLDAITRSNFISITDLDIAEVRVWDDLARGYFYGPDPVMRVTMELELAYLRSWTTQFMPNRVKELLGVPLPVEDEFDDFGGR